MHGLDRDGSTGPGTVDTFPAVTFQQIMFSRPVPLFGLLWLLNGCDAQETPATDRSSGAMGAPIPGDTVTAWGRDLDWICEDRKGHHWIASNGDGVYHYDGRTLRHITRDHGLCSNYVWKIEEDVNGALWFTTREGFCRYSDAGFEDFTASITKALTGPPHPVRGGLCFGHANGVCYYDGRSFTNFSITPAGYQPERNNGSRPYSIYCTLQDRSGDLWFGTEQKGVCRFDGTGTTWFTDAGLDAAAVRCMFQDKAGDLWFGNNGAGLFRYDGRSIANITEAKGLGNPEFLKRAGGDKPGSLARVWSLADDTAGNLCIGTIDAGFWMLIGNELTNFTTRDGLPGNAIWHVHKDSSGEVWIITNGDSISRFDGRTFRPLRSE